MDDPGAVRKEFGDGVNMTASELEDWLARDESRSVGQKDGGGESVGHEMGRHIIDLLRTRKDDLSERDLERMQKVNGYVARHSKQRPSGDVSDTP